MRIAPLASIALIAACTGDLSIVEAENDPPAISLVTDQTSYLQGETVTLTADVRDDNTPWDLLTVLLDVEGAELSGPNQLEERAGLWEWTFPANRDDATVTVTAVDDRAASASESLTLDIADNTAPTIAFDLPAADARIAPAVR